MNFLENCFKVIQNIPNSYFNRQEDAANLLKQSENSSLNVPSDIYLYYKDYHQTNEYYQAWNARNLRFASRTQRVLSFLDCALNILFLPVTLPLALAKDLFLLLVKFPAFITISTVKAVYKMYYPVKYLSHYIFGGDKKEANISEMSIDAAKKNPQESLPSMPRFIRTSLIENILNTMSFPEIFNSRIEHAKLLGKYAGEVRNFVGIDPAGETPAYKNFNTQYGLSANNQENYTMNALILKLESFFQIATAYIEIVPNAVFFTANLALALVKDIFFIPVKSSFFAARKTLDFYAFCRYTLGFKDKPANEDSQDQGNDFNNNPFSTSPTLRVPVFETPRKDNTSSRFDQSSNQDSQKHILFAGNTDKNTKEPNLESDEEKLSTNRDSPFVGLPI